MSKLSTHMISKFLLSVSISIFLYSCDNEEPIVDPDYTGEFGQLTDIQGNVYKTMGIGSQIWMAENLKSTLLNTGEIITEVKNDSLWAQFMAPGYCWYNNDPVTNWKTYGALYNFYVVNTGLLCPVGWHVPDKSEWETLAGFVGGEKVAGGMLKQLDGSHWKGTNICYQNNYNFVALPGGRRMRSTGKFRDMGYWGNWWTSTPNDFFYAESKAMSSDRTSLIRLILKKTEGCSVRCIKD